jgi:peptidoglycan/xylan/chitin deacetylase (PgdA/CDA1 family)
MYHNSSEDNPGALYELYVKPSEFEKQIKYLVDNGYTFCTFDDWFNVRNIEKPVFITFDDGYEENYTEIFPILKEYNAKITLFLITDPINARRRLTEDMIREMSDSGLVKFESHTMSHPNLAKISADTERLIDEFQQSKAIIERITGRRVLAISYPGGRFDHRVKEKAREFYTFGVSTLWGKHNTGYYDDFEIRRIAIGRSTTIEEFSGYLRGYLRN